MIRAGRGPGLNAADLRGFDASNSPAMQTKGQRQCLFFFIGNTPQSRFSCIASKDLAPAVLAERHPPSLYEDAPVLFKLRNLQPLLVLVGLTDRARAHHDAGPDPGRWTMAGLGSTVVLWTEPMGARGRELLFFLF